MQTAKLIVLILILLVFIYIAREIRSQRLKITYGGLPLSQIFPVQGFNSNNGIPSNSVVVNPQKPGGVSNFIASAQSSQGQIYSSIDGFFGSPNRNTSYIGGM